MITESSGVIPSGFDAFVGFISRFGLGWGIAAGTAWAVYRGFLRLGRETEAERRAAKFEEQADGLRIALAKSERDLEKWQAIAMKFIQAAEPILNESKAR